MIKITVDTPDGVFENEASSLPRSLGEYSPILSAFRQVIGESAFVVIDRWQEVEAFATQCGPMRFRDPEDRYSTVIGDDHPSGPIVATVQWIPWHDTTQETGH